MHKVRRLLLCRRQLPQDDFEKVKLIAKLNIALLPENCTKWEEYCCIEDDCLSDDFEKIPFGLLILLLFCYFGHLTLFLKAISRLYLSHLCFFPYIPKCPPESWPPSMHFVPHFICVQIFLISYFIFVGDKMNTSQSTQ